MLFYCVHVSSETELYHFFGNLRQEEGETIDAFVTRLREKAATCEYGTLRDQLIRDRLVLGITDESTRRPSA